MQLPNPIVSIPGLTEVVWHPGTTGPVLLLECPHGATSAREYHAVADTLRSKLPDDLVDFFHVNTDFATPECATHLARAVQDLDPRISVLILRCQLPRTFADCNRTLSGGTGKMTAAIPSYIKDAADRNDLAERHQRYLQQAGRAYAFAIDEGGGMAITLHSYAPRSVGIDHVDDNIVAALHDAYRPETFQQWPQRPQVELITNDATGECLLDDRWLQELRDCYRDAKIPLAENETYQLHDGTLAADFSRRHPGQVLCIEFNRQRLAQNYRPFVELVADAVSIDRDVAPLALATTRELTRRIIDD